MRHLSIRGRLVLTSAALSAVVLTVFAGTAWILMSRMSLARLDGIITGHLARQPEPAAGPDQWRRLDDRLNSSEGDEDPPVVILRVRSVPGRLLYESDHWPDSLGANRLPVAPPNPAPVGRPVGPRPGEPNAPRPPMQGRSPSPMGPPPGRAGRTGPVGPPQPLPRPVFETLKVDGEAWRMGVQSYPGATVYMGARVAHFAPELRQLRLVFLLTLPLGLVLIGGTSWAVAGGALGPVRRLADSLDRITARGLDARLEWPTSDREFLRLSAALNDMLQRLERSFHQATRFSADAAHELKTPLTVLQGELEAALRDPSVAAEEGALYTDLLEEVQRLKAIVEKLLLLSRADAGALRVSAQPFDLSSAAENLVEDMDIMAEELEVEGRITSGIQVMADPDLLTHVLGNLATNAMRYTPEGGWIRVEVDQGRGKARLAVANGPVDIPAADRSRVFDRFVRLDPARTRRGEGSGLGLSLAREIARVHGGDLTLVEAPGREATFLLELPLASATAGGTPPARGSERPSSASP